MLLCSTVFFIFLFHSVFSLDTKITSVIPSCTNCKWFLAKKNGFGDTGFCKLFKETYLNKELGREMTYYNFAVHCRKNENQCGPEGNLFDPIDIDKNEDVKELKEMINDYNNRCCGEVNETHEIIQLEKDYYNLMNSIKNLKQKRIDNFKEKLRKIINEKLKE